MSKNVIVLLVFLFAASYSFSQGWKINPIVFGGNALHISNRTELIIPHSTGYWFSSDYGNSFSYKNYEYNTGVKFDPENFNFSSINKDSIIINATNYESGIPSKYLSFYDTKKSEFFEISIDSSDKKIITPFSFTQKIYGFKYDSLFEFNELQNSYEFLKKFDLGNYGIYGFRSFHNLENGKILARSSGSIREGQFEFTRTTKVFILDLKKATLVEKLSFESSSNPIPHVYGKNLYLSGDYGQVFYSEDFGESWINIGLGEHFTVNCSFQTNDTGVCYNANYFEGLNFYCTSNGGEDWLEVELPKDLINVKGAAIKNNKVLVFGFDTVYQQTRLYQTDDITQHSIINTIKGGQPAPIGLAESTSQNTINIYPNPTNQNFTIKATEIPKVIKLFNANGQLVLQTKPTQSITQIQVSQLPKGLCFVQIQQQNGESMLRKVVVH